MSLLNQEICNSLQSLGAEAWEPIIRAHADAAKRNIDVLDYFKRIPVERLKTMTGKQIDLMAGKFAICHFGRQRMKSDFQLGINLSEILLKGILPCQFKGEVSIFRVVCFTLKIVERINVPNIKPFLMRQISESWQNIAGEILPPAIASSLAETWIYNSKYISMPVRRARAGDDVWCLYRTSAVPDVNAPFNSWRRILNRMSDGDAFAAWVYGVYSGLYKGRQILWLWGPHGEDGKSTIARIIGEQCFGPTFQSISNSAMSSSEKRFLLSSFIDAELVCYPDADNKRILQSEEFKMLANGGTDKVRVEKKFKDPTDEYLKARVWIISNHMPEIENNNFSISRLLFLKINKMVGEKPDPNAVGLLESELNGFLAYAEKCYERLCPDHYKIEINEETATLLKDCVNSKSDYFLEIYEKHWEAGTENDRIESSIISKCLRIEGLTSTKEIGEFHQWLEQNKGVVKRKVSASNGKSFLYGIKRKNSLSAVANLLAAPLK